MNGNWHNYYEKYKETLSTNITENVVKIISCGQFMKGYREYCCSNPECFHVKSVPQSCNSRFCPTCGKRATDQWIHKQKEILPQCPWQHITLTMPKTLWGLFKKYQYLLNKFAKLAADIFIKIAKKKGIIIGIFIAIHTFGRDLKWHPHIHLSVTAGGLHEKSNVWKNIQFFKKHVMKMWRYQIIKLLRSEVNNNHIHCSLKRLNKDYNRLWIIHLSKIMTDPFHNIAYLGRYLKRPPISMSRLKHYDANGITFRFLNHRNHKHEDYSVDIEHFIYLFTQHIPKKYFRLIRYYGMLANRVRKKFLTLVYGLFEQTPNLKKLFFWRHNLIKEFNYDPLKCIVCGSLMVFYNANKGLSHRQIMQHHKKLALRQIVPLP